MAELMPPVYQICYLLTVLITSAKEVMFSAGFVCPSVCLFLCEQDNSKTYGRILIKLQGYV